MTVGMPGSGVDADPLATGSVVGVGRKVGSGAVRLGWGEDSCG
jgi:hypothetical protein